MTNQMAVEFINVTKEFGEIKANEKISFKVKKGNIHAIIGENGAGKSTLMSMLFGLYERDYGSIFINGKEIYFKNPFEANEAGIGMVHQHFKLVEVYTNLQNIVLGFETETQFKTVNWKLAELKIKKLQDKYNLHFDLKEKTGNATVATQQKVEIMKMLYKNADILIFDEPTAVLNDHEIQGLLKTMKLFKKNGKTILFISHKLNEIKQVCDQATVIRLGKVVKNFDDLKNVEVKELARAMVGHDIDMPKNFDEAKRDKLVLEFQNVSAKGNKQVKNISFKLHAGEILAIAGVEGNGQEEIEFLVSGMLKPKSGKILRTTYEDKTPKTVDITNFSVKQKWQNKINYVPGDRHKYGLVLDMNVIDNSILRMLYHKKTSVFGFIKNKFKNNLSNQILQDFDVRGARGGMSFARSLSGGNQQKTIVGREITNEHEILLVVQPTRGLDVGAINLIHQKIIEQRNKGTAILLISYELDEVLSLADSILVVNKGEIVDSGNKKVITRESIGMMMAGTYKKKEVKGEEMHE
ncbi:ABC transporter ATP-binding protein [Mycoplasma iguanae]|uniref:ABC transporter ATP-binding protein n=1 Tax=Mycoplasma iguanae TaxID=292461 RepID=A0ABY5R891_9MOLU|nr:ABC transporter ATP-binding protein [Mycoplasma iguanae]UVD81709.1 ABC transporter ATP-binding protein [Mycoplasma iguanae]